MSLSELLDQNAKLGAKKSPDPQKLLKQPSALDLLTPVANPLQPKTAPQKSRVSLPTPKPAASGLSGPIGKGGSNQPFDPSQAQIVPDNPKGKSSAQNALKMSSPKPNSVEDLHRQARELEKEIQSDEAAGIDTLDKRLKGANIYLELQKKQGIPQQINGQEPLTHAQSALQYGRNVKPGETLQQAKQRKTQAQDQAQAKPAVDPFKGLPFTQQSFQQALDNGDNIVRGNSGSTLSRADAEKALARNYAKLGYQAPRFEGNAEKYQNREARQEDALSPNANNKLTGISAGNDSGVERMSKSFGDFMHKYVTGAVLYPLEHYGPKGTRDFSRGIEEGVNDLLDPVQQIQFAERLTNKKGIGEVAQGLGDAVENLFDVKSQTPEGYARNMVGVALAAAGLGHAIPHLRMLILKGRFGEVAGLVEKLGVDPERAKLVAKELIQNAKPLQELEEAVQKQEASHGAHPAEHIDQATSKKSLEVQPEGSQPKIDLSGMGKGISDGFWDAMKKSVHESGDVPKGEQKSLVGQVFKKLVDDGRKPVPETLDEVREIIQEGGNDAKKVSDVYNKRSQLEQVDHHAAVQKKVKELSEKTPEELHVEADKAKAVETAQYDALFGKDGAKEFMETHGKLDSERDPATRQKLQQKVDDMEASLTPEQQKILHGDEDASYASPDEIRQVAEHAKQIQAAPDVSSLADVSHDAFEAVADGRKSPVDLTVVDKSLKRATELGLTRRELIETVAKKIGSTPEEIEGAIESGTRTPESQRTEPISASDEQPTGVAGGGESTPDRLRGDREESAQPAEGGEPKQAPGEQRPVSADQEGQRGGEPGRPVDQREQQGSSGSGAAGEGPEGGAKPVKPAGGKRSKRPVQPEAGRGTSPGNLEGQAGKPAAIEPAVPAERAGGTDESRPADLSVAKDLGRDAGSIKRAKQRAKRLERAAAKSAKAPGTEQPAGGESPQPSTSQVKPNVTPDGDPIGETPGANARRFVVNGKNWLKQSSTSMSRTWGYLNGLGDVAKEGAYGLRAMYGFTAERGVVRTGALKWSHDFFSKMPREENIEFIRRLQAGEEQPTPELQRIDKAIRGTTDKLLKDVQALGKLKQFQENYFPGLWEKPNKVKAWIEAGYGDAEEANEAQIGMLKNQRRPMEGNKGFLKQKKFLTIQDGIDAGFKPLSDNPVDMLLAQAHQMDLFIESHRFLEAQKKLGHIEFHASHSGPKGWSRLDDNLFKVFGSGMATGDIPIHEAYDERMMKQLDRVAKQIGVRHSRDVSVPGHGPGVFGSYKDSQINTRIGTPVSEYAHEMGHAIQDKFNLNGYLKAQKNYKAINAEMKRIGRLRYEKSKDVPDDFKSYVQTPDEQSAEMVKAYIYNRRIMESEAPNALQAFEKFIMKHKELHGIEEIEPRLAVQTNIGHMRVQLQSPGIEHVMGYYYAPDNLAAVINNSLSKGLRDMHFVKTFMAINNSINRFNLGLSAFHFTGTALNASITENALGLQKLVGGDILGAGKSTAKGSVPFLAAYDYYKKGKTIEEIGKLGADNAFQGVDPALAQTARAVALPGGRFGTSLEHAGQAKAAFQKALGRHQFARAALHAPNAILEMAHGPLMEKFVPRVKLGAYHQLLQHEIQMHPGEMTPTQWRDACIRSWDSVDNRFGQLVHDNIFWNAMVRDSARLSVRSIGWTLGTIKEVGGALGDVPELVKNKKLGNRLSYTTSLFATTALWGGMMHYAMTGKAPESVKDLYFPRTGRKNADGTDERLNLPTYMKDIFGIAQGPLDWAHSKMSPGFSTALSAITGEDYYGNKIANKDDPWYDQGLDYLKYAAQSAEPFSIQSSIDQIQNTGDFGGAATSFMGLNKAPAYVSKSVAFREAQERLYAGIPKGKQTRADAERSRSETAIVGLLRNGNKEQAMKRMKDLDLSVAEQRKLTDRSKENALISVVRKLTVGDAMAVWDKATPDEKKQIRRIVADKISRAHGGDAKKKLSSADYHRDLDLLNAK